MAKVLITGFTPRHCGSQKLLREYVNGAQVLPEILRLAGHEVEVRPVKPGETLDGYDCALVGVAPPLTVVTTHLLGSLWAVSRLGRRAALWAEDWSMEHFQHHTNTCLRNPRKYVFERPFKRAHQDEALQLLPPEAWGDLLRDVAQNAARPLLAWFHGWGDAAGWAAKVKAPGAVRAWDPSGFLRERPWLSCGLKDPLWTPPGPSYPKERCWVSASLQKCDPWLSKLGLKWPVYRLGNKRQGQPVLRERDVVGYYAPRWGVLCPKYKAHGTGWWRARYLHAAFTGSVLLCDRRDAPTPAYDQSPLELETLPDDRLEAIAAAQARDLWAQSWPAERAVRALDDLVREVGT